MKSSYMLSEIPIVQEEILEADFLYNIAPINYFTQSAYWQGIIISFASREMIVILIRRHLIYSYEEFPSDRRLHSTHSSHRWYLLRRGRCSEVVE